MHHIRKTGGNVRNRGVTLIEVVISIIVMALGMLGLLAILPAAAQYTRESAEETQAAIIADSVKHSLTEAIKRAQYNASTETWTTSFAHDLKFADSIGSDEFSLPKLTDNADAAHTASKWRHHPSPAKKPGHWSKKDGNLFDPGADYGYSLESDAWLKATTSDIRSKNDPTEPTKYYSFSFDIRKVNTRCTGAALSQDEAKALDKIVKDYEVRINVMRVSSAGGSSGGETITTSAPAFEVISSFTFKVSVP